MLSKTAMSRQALGHGKRVSLPIPYDPVRHKGFSVIGTDNNMYVSNGTAWIQIYTFDPDAPPITALTSSIEFTVGSGGDFPNLNAVFEYLSVFQPYYRADWPTAGTATVIVRILSGTVLAEQLSFINQDMSWVYIYADDATVEVDPTALEIATSYVDREHALFFSLGTALPNITGITFTLGVGTIPQDSGLIARIGAYTPKSTCFSVRDGSLISMGTYEVSAVYRLPGAEGWNKGATVGNNSRISALGGNFSNCFEVGLTIQNGSRAKLWACDATGAGTTGINVAANSQISVTNSTPLIPGFSSNFRKSVGIDSVNDIVVTNGSFADIGNGVLGGTNTPANAVTNNGIIFRGDVGPAVPTGIFKPDPYTVGTLPDVAVYDACLIHVADGDTGSPCLAVSNGTNWLRIALGAAVST